VVAPAGSASKVITVKSELTQIIVATGTLSTSPILNFPALAGSSNVTLKFVASVTVPESDKPSFLAL